MPLCRSCACTKHRYWALSSVRMCTRCTACWPLFSMRVHGKQVSFFSLYTVRARTVYSTIVVLLSARMRTVRNNNSCLNFRACARNLSPLNRATAATQRYLQTSFCDLPCKLSFPHSAFYPLFRRPFRIFGFCIFRGAIKKFCNSL